MLGPFGLIAFTMICDKICDKVLSFEDLHQQFIQRQKQIWHLVYEVVFFYGRLGYFVSGRGNLLILYEAARTGTSVTAIIDQQNASGDMWAFSEGMEILWWLPATSYGFFASISSYGLPKLGVYSKKELNWR